MSGARDDILSAARRAVGREGAAETARAAAVATRLERHARNLVPKRAQLDAAGRRALFLEMAERAAATVVALKSVAEVPAAVADFLATHNLPARLRLADEPALVALPWAERPLLKLEGGKAEARDSASLTAAFAGVAETGTLMLVSSPQSPTSLNFLPDNHIVLLREGQIVGPFEDAWDRLRQAAGGKEWPRAVNFITGPSRSADIEQQLYMGAHGPRRLHILLVAEESDGQAQG